jgi:hypothetical protein
LLVGTGRFELPTPRTPSECSTRLSHVPTGRNSQLQSLRMGFDLEILTSVDRFYLASKPRFQKPSTQGICRWIPIASLWPKISYAHSPPQLGYYRLTICWLLRLEALRRALAGSSNPILISLLSGSLVGHLNGPSAHSAKRRNHRFRSQIDP